MLMLGGILIAVLGLFVLNTYLISRGTLRATLKGINAGGRAAGLREDLVTEDDVKEAKNFDDLPEEVS